MRNIEAAHAHARSSRLLTRNGKGCTTSPGPLAHTGIYGVDSIHSQRVRILHAGPPVRSLPANVERIRFVEDVIHNAMCSQRIGIDGGRHTLPALRAHLRLVVTDTYSLTP